MYKYIGPKILTVDVVNNYNLKEGSSYHWYSRYPLYDLNSYNKVKILKNYDNYILVDTGKYKTTILKTNIYTGREILTKEKIEYLEQTGKERSKSPMNKIISDYRKFYNSYINNLKRFNIKKGEQVLNDKAKFIKM